MDVQKFINTLREAYGLAPAEPNKFVKEIFKKAVLDIHDSKLEQLVEDIRTTESRFPDASDLQKIIGSLGYYPKHNKTEQDEYYQSLGMSFFEAMAGYQKFCIEYPNEMYNEIKAETEDGIFAAQCKIAFLPALNNVLEKFRLWFEENKIGYKGYEKFNLKDMRTLGALANQNSPLRREVKEECERLAKLQHEIKNKNQYFGIKDVIE